MRPVSRDDRFPQEIGTREKRKLRHRRSRGGDAWFGLGTLGVVGFAVAVPTVLGALLGLWLDAAWPKTFSWTLTLLLLGLLLGLFNAWQWISRERSAIEKERENGDENADG